MGRSPHTLDLTHRLPCRRARAATAPACVAVTYALLSLAGLASAAVFHVPGEYGTIQAGIDAAVPGDTVLVAPGTYRGTGNRDLTLRGKDIILLGRDGADHTVIDAEFQGRGFHLGLNFEEWETRAARIEGFTIMRGRAAYGAGILCGVSSPTISQCRFWSNDANVVGGAIYLICSDALVEECVIHANSTNGMGAGLASECGDPLIRNCVITGNWGYHGGGVAFPGTGTGRLYNCTVAANLATYSGGIMAAVNPVELDRCIVWGNCAFLEGDEIGPSGIVRCSVVDSSGSNPNLVYDEYCRFTDPGFCAPSGCGITDAGDWTLEAGSICLPEHSPCGQLIGALGQGCGGPPPMGACCLSDGSCVLRTSGECAAEPGTYLGDFTACEPNPCGVIPVQRITWGRIKAAYR